MNRRVPERHALLVSQTGDVVGRQRMSHDRLLWSSWNPSDDTTEPPANFFHLTRQPLDYARVGG